MFKLESYITPILLSYVDKYIKNFRPEDAQVSLWGGDASFHNLDLRLEVLEQELQLPFSFVSGHIHELMIHVPWTKLASEPITITINTIECILKLRGDESIGSDTTSTSSVTREQRKKIPRQKEEVATPPGYVQSLVNKIVSNISINCNNLILKYVEEDIVVSVNIRMLRFSSADEKWRPAFTDLNPGQILLRKLVTITDLTICLDKRNAAGKIDVYQEPMLYRCSMEIRILQCYHTASSKKSSTTRVDMHCTSMEFSMTEQQMPMLIRLIMLGIALQSKLFKSDPEQVTDGVDEEIETDDFSHAEESWAGWAWSFVPSIFPVSDVDWNNEQQQIITGHSVHFGAYIDNVSFAFKVSECINEGSYYVPKKLKYWPLLRVNVKGMFGTIIQHGATFKNIQAGLSQVALIPQGNCCCGFPEVVEGVESIEYLKVGSLSNNSYQQDSLFDVESIENKGQRRIYNVSWEHHINNNSEAVMLERTPAFAVDLLYNLELPDDMNSEKLSEFGSCLEYSNLPERTLNRYVCGPLKMNVCSGLLHRLSTVQLAAATYDYSPYSLPVAEPSLVDLKPPCEDDYDALLENIPRNIIQFTAFKPKIEIYLLDHGYFEPMKGNLFRKRRKSSNSFQMKTNTVLVNIPRLTIECQCIDAKMMSPQYPNRLVYTTCQLPTAPTEMFNACYTHVHVKVLGAASQLITTDKVMPMLMPCSISVTTKRIIKPDYWVNPDIAHLELFITADNVIFTTTKAKMLTALYIAQSYRAMDDKLKHEVMNTTLLTDATKDPGMGYLELRFENIKYHNVKTISTVIHQLTLGAIKGYILESKIKTKVNVFPKRRGSEFKYFQSKLSEAQDYNNELQQVMVVSGPESTDIDIDAAESPFLTIIVQYSINGDHQVHPPILTYNIAELKLCFDPLLYRWLLYQPKVIKEANSTNINKPYSDTNSTMMDTPRRMINPQDSVHSSSDRDQIFNTSIPYHPPTKDTDDAVEPTKILFDHILLWYSTWCSAVIFGKISHCSVYFPTSSLAAVGVRNIQEALDTVLAYDRNLEVMIVKLPTFNMRNASQRQSLQQYAHRFPIKLPDTMWLPNKNCFPWSISILELSCCTIQNGVKIHFLKPFSLNATIGLSVKQSSSTMKRTNEAFPTESMEPSKLSGVLDIVASFESRLMTSAYTNSGSANLLSSMAVCVHLDTTPICIALSDKQICLMASIWYGLQDVIGKMFPSIINKPPPILPKQICVHQRLPTGSTPSISIFRESTPETTSESSPNMPSPRMDLDEDPVKLSAWFQWTIARLRIKLYCHDFQAINAESTSFDSDPDLKMVFDAEDIMTSVDIQKVYIKVKSKIASAHIHQYKRTKKNTWETGAFLGIVMRGQDDVIPIGPAREDQDGFLTVTVTRARCGHVHHKWGATSKTKLSDTKLESKSARINPKSTYITEVVIAVQPIDILISLVTLRNFLMIIEPLLTPSSDTSVAASAKGQDFENTLFALNNHNLPLLYLECRELRFMLPSNQLLNKMHSHDVCIFQVGSINLAPTAENPICRTQLRPDIYQQAARSRILNVPGSDIEDRQYQLNLSSFSLSTGRWEELDPILNMRDSVASSLRTMNENPALEWNNLDQGRLNLMPNFNSLYIISRLDLCIIYAPAIVSNNDILICGHSLEVNCTSDLETKVCTTQILLASALTIEFCALFEPLLADIYSRKRPKLKSPYLRYFLSPDFFHEQMDELEIRSTDYIKDSGIDLADFSSDFTSNKGDTETRRDFDTSGLGHGDRNKSVISLHVPFDVLITGGNISFTLYILEANSKPSNWNRYKCDIMSEDRGYEASEEGSLEEVQFSDTRSQPLVYVLLSQLNVFVSRLTFERKIQLSCYNIKAKISLAQNLIKGIPTEAHFETNLLETKTGEPNPNTGIYPAFLTAKVCRRAGKKIDVTIEIARPTKIHFSLTIYAYLLSIRDQISAHMFERKDVVTETVTGVGCTQTVEPSTPLEMYTRFKQIQHICFGITSLNVQIAQIVFAVTTKTNSEVIVSCAKISSHLAIRTRPERITNTLSFECLTLSVIKSEMSRLLLNPWSSGFEINLFWESWQDVSSDPQIQISGESDCIMLEVGSEHLKCLETVVQEFNEFMNNIKFDESTDEVNPTLASIQSAPVFEKDQHYKDDLRAGAFQFVDSSMGGASEELPLPYQVVFSKHPQTAMSWRYPQPRSLTKVRVFPVPFRLSTGDADVQNQIVLCCIEYWSEARCSYVSFANFELSESEMYQLDLPRLQPQPAISCTWRVVLLNTDLYQNNFEHTQNLLSPRALAACIRIDSYFNPNLIPKIQLSLNISTLHLSLFNFFNKNLVYRMPAPMKEYTPDELIPENQRFLTFAFEKARFYIAVWNSDEAYLDVDGCIKCDVLDYAFLSNQSFIEPTALTLSLSVSKNLDLNLSTKPLKVKFGPSIGHTLAISLELWNQSWNTRNTTVVNELEMVVLTRYVVCNDTNVNIRFGQAATDEDILLASRHCHLYSWRSQKCKQLMRVGLEENGWNWSIPFEIGGQGTRVCVINENTSAIIILTVKSLSTTQKQITFSGQLLISNMLNEQFELKVIPRGEVDKEKFRSTLTHFVAGKSKYPSMLLNHNEEVALRIRYYGLESAWSGDIPMLENTNCDQPWLVKVPLHERGQFLSVWCRVIIQRMGSTKRMLAMFWPLFMIRSNLPVDAKVNIETPTLEVFLETTIAGQGKLQQLYCPGTTDHSHQLTFKLESSTPSNPYVPLNYSLVNQKDFFKKQDNYDIDAILDSFVGYSKTEWPFSEDFVDADWIADDQPLTHVQVRYDNVCPFSSSLLIELLPWSLLLNTTGYPLAIIVNEREVCRVAHYGVLTPPKFEEPFNLGVGIEDSWYESSPIDLDLIPQIGNITVTIQCDLQISRLLINSYERNEMRILAVSTGHSITNHTEFPLRVCCMAVPEDNYFNDIPTNVNEFSFHVPAHLNKRKCGIPIIQWVQLGVCEPSTEPALYILLTLDNKNEYSCPVKVNHIMRQSIGVPIGDRCLAFAVTVDENRGQMNISVHRDIYPQLVIENKCKFDVVCAERSQEKNRTPMKDIEHFTWKCSVKPNCLRYFTMPSVTAKFPDISQSFTVPKLIIAANKAKRNDKYNMLDWSQEINVGISNEHYVRNATMGDIKVTVDVKCHTTNVIIDGVSQVEFSAGDVRNRLSYHEALTRKAEVTRTLLQEALSVHSLNNALYGVSEISSNTSKTHRTAEVQTSHSYHKLPLARKLSILQEVSHDNLETSNAVSDSISTDVIPSRLSFLQLKKKISLSVSSFVLTLTNDLLDDVYKTTEIAGLSLDNVCVNVQETEGEKMLSVIISEIQFDNQLYCRGNHDFPVVLIGKEGDVENVKVPSSTTYSVSSIPRGSIDRSLTETMFFEMNVIMNTWKQVNYLDQIEEFSGIHEVRVSLKPFSAYIEDTYLTELMDYLVSLLPINLVILHSVVKEKHSLCNANYIRIHEQILAESEILARPVRMSVLVIEPVKGFISIHTHLKVFIALDHSPVNFASFERQNIITTPYRLGHALTMHFLSGAIVGAGWVVGSLGILGSPGGLARSVGTGLRDFVSMPYEGMLQGPWGFVVGVTQGSASLVKNITAGTLNSVSKMASSLARNLDRLSLDEEHLQRTEEARRSRPQGLMQGLVYGFSGLGISVLGALGGLAHHPLQSMVNDGSPMGLAAGVGRGLVGVITKPLSGAAELLAVTGQGILHQAGWQENPTPRTTPVITHIFNANNDMVKYSWKLLPDIVGPGTNILYVTEATAISGKNDYEAVALVLTPKALILVNTDEDTTQRIIMLKDLIAVNNTNDPTLLSFDFVKQAVINEDILEMDPAAHARVADYVRNASGLVELPQMEHRDLTHSVSSAESPSLRFYVNPQSRNYFLSILALAKRQNQHKGFSVL